MDKRIYVGALYKDLSPLGRKIEVLSINGKIIKCKFHKFGNQAAICGDMSLKEVIAWLNDPIHGVVMWDQFGVYAKLIL